MFIFVCFSVTPAPPRPPVVASHNLPQQPSRPSATATAAPVKKNVINSQPKPPGIICHSINYNYLFLSIFVPFIIALFSRKWP